MRAKPARCDGCAARDIARGFVPGRGPSNAKLALVGQGPGEDEAWTGQPFVGKAGRQLDLWIVRADAIIRSMGCLRGLHRTNIWITNTVMCWLPGNREPTRAEAAFCWKVNVSPELDRLRGTLQAIVPIGVPAMEVILNDRKVGERTAGSVFRRDLDTVLAERAN